jgi:hypothetical protein
MALAAVLAVALPLGLAGLGQDGWVMTKEGSAEKQAKHTPARSCGRQGTAERIKSFVVHRGAALLTHPVLKTESSIVGRLAAKCNAVESNTVEPTFDRLIPLTQ